MVFVFLFLTYFTLYVHGPFKTRFSIPCSFMFFLDIFLIGFQSQVFEGLICLGQDLGVGVPDVELKSLTP